MTILNALLISLAINAVFFLFAAILKTDIFTDITYALSFIALSIYLYLTADTLTPSLLVSLLIAVLWAVRLGGYLFTRILKTKVDHRFDDKRGNPLRFAIFWTLQALTVWIVMLPLAGMSGNTTAATLPAAPFLILGAIIALAGLLLETVSDFQKSAFKKAGRGTFTNTGLWALSRHPNYFGEMLVWWGIGLISFPWLSGPSFLCLIGPLFITLLLRYVSGVPLLEKSWEEKWGHDPEFRAWREKTRLLLPLPRLHR